MKENKKKLMTLGAIKVITFIISVILLQKLILMPLSAFSLRYWSKYDGRGLNEPWFMSSIAAGLLVTLVVCFVFIKFFDKKDWSYIRFKSENKLKLFLIGSGTSFMLVFLYTAFMLLLGQIRVTFEPKSLGGLLFYFPLSIVGVFMALLIEELISRGYILRTLETHFNVIFAICFSSLQFSLFHFLRPNSSLPGFVNIFLIGCTFSLLCIYFKSLWLPIGLHFGWNYTLYLFNMPISGHQYPYQLFHTSYSKYTLLSGTQFGPEDSALLTILLVIFIGSFFLKFREEILHKKLIM